MILTFYQRKRYNPDYRGSFVTSRGVMAIFRSYFWVLNMAFVAMGAYLLADTANFFVAARLEETMLSPASNPISNRGANQNKTALMSRDYRSIIEKNIFGSGMPDFVPVKYTPPPPMILPPLLPPPPVLQVTPPKEPLNMTLIGTVVSADGPAQSYAVIEDGRTHRQYMYRIGDFLLQDAKLVQIFRTRVVISRGDEEEVLVTGLSGLQGNNTKNPPASQTGIMPPGTRRERSPDGGIRQVARDRWVMDREDVDDAIANLPELLTKARVVPNFADGKPDGFRIFAIREDSLYAKIGLKNGDILKQVNNIEVGNPQNFLSVFEKLKGEPNINIKLGRDGKDESINVDIR